MLHRAKCQFILLLHVTQSKKPSDSIITCYTEQIAMSFYNNMLHRAKCQVILLLHVTQSKKPSNSIITCYTEQNNKYCYSYM